MFTSIMNIARFGQIYVILPFDVTSFSSNVCNVESRYGLKIPCLYSRFAFNIIIATILSQR